MGLQRPLWEMEPRWGRERDSGFTGLGGPFMPDPEL